MKKKLAELTEEELAAVTGGGLLGIGQLAGTEPDNSRRKANGMKEP